MAYKIRCDDEADVVTVGAHARAEEFIRESEFFR